MITITINVRDLLNKVAVCAVMALAFYFSLGIGTSLAASVDAVYVDSGLAQVVSVFL
jgi:hypothetical protein